MIARSIQLMLEELEPNSFEDKTLQRLVDFGHTFSSTLEERSEYELRHGEAVAVDMALTCELAARLGILDREECDRILDTFAVLGLPVSSAISSGSSAADAMEVTMAHRGGNLNLVVPRTIGAGNVRRRGATTVPADVVAAAIDALRARARGGRADPTPDRPPAARARRGGAGAHAGVAMSTTTIRSGASPSLARPWSRRAGSR